MMGHNDPSKAPSPPAELQLAVLQAIPTPILVLSPARKAVFANRAAEKLFGGVAAEAIYGRTLAELGVEAQDSSWSTVLDEFSLDLNAVSNKRDSPTSELDVVLRNREGHPEERHFRILLAQLMIHQDQYRILSFENAPHPRTSYNYDEELRSPLEGRSPFSTGPSGERSISISSASSTGSNSLKDLARLKSNVFDSCGVPAFILSADENLYITNTHAREMIGAALGDEHGGDGRTTRAKLDIWDPAFTKRLPIEEYPGIRLVRSRTAFKNMRCGFTHSLTKQKKIMNIIGEPLYDAENGEFIGGICWCHDLQNYDTFLSNRQNQLLISHETILNLMPHLVWTATPEGECDYCSQRWMTWTGLTREQTYGFRYKDAVHPEDREHVAQVWYEARKTGKPLEVEARYRRHDGVYQWMLVRTTPWRDENTGKILKWYGTNTNIHDSVMRRIEAARHKTQVLTVLAHAEVNLFSVDKDNKATLMEGGMILQNEPEDKSDYLGRDIFELCDEVQPGGLPDVERGIRDVLAGRVQVASCEDVVGERVFKTRIVPELEHDGKDGGQKPAIIGALGLSIDITDMKARAKLEIDNSRLQIEEQAAQDANRMKSQFLANMSHELRTPAAGVIGMVELLADDPTLSTEQLEYINSISLSSKALLAIVNDILDFSKIESGRLDIEEVPFNLNSTVCELCKLLGMFAQQKGLDFACNNDLDERLEVLGDSGRIRQVLSNILTNSLKFTSQGSVKTSIKSKPLPSNVLGQELLEVTFVIEDTGIGIEKKVLETLFRPFHQGDSSTSRLYGGTGLGLTISRNLAILMGGSLELDSEYAKGSKATFKVPLKVSSWTSSAPSACPRRSPNPGFRFHTKPLEPINMSEPLMHRSLSQDLLEQSTLDQNMLNQQISNSVTDHYASGPFSRASMYITNLVGAPLR